MEGVKEVCNSQFLSAVSELCHMDTSLAEWVWLQFFPRIWKILSEKQQQVCKERWIICLLVSGWIFYTFDTTLSEDTIAESLIKHFMLSLFTLTSNSCPFSYMFPFSCISFLLIIFFSNGYFFPTYLSSNFFITNSV